MIGCAVPHHYSNTKWPIISRDGQYALAVFGEIYLPDGTPLRNNNFDDGFLRPFLESGVDFVRELGGNFNLALMCADECYVVNDAFGTFPAHYSAANRQFAFSTQMLPLHRLNPDKGIDEKALFEHLALSQSLSSRTMFRDVRRLARGTILQYTRSGIKTSEYINRRFHPSASVMPELETVYASVGTAIEQSANYPRVTAALSGGFDSRMTWSVLLARSFASDVVASTHGLPNSRDMMIAGRIADGLDLRADRIAITKSDLADFPRSWRQFVEITEGHHPLSQIFAHHAMRLLGERFSVLIDSYGGVLYRRQIKKRVEPSIGPQRELVPQILRYELTALATSGLLNPIAQQEMYRYSLDGLREYYAGIESVATIGDKFDLFYADQTAALRDCFSAAHQMNFIGVLQPLLNRRAFDAIRRIPGAVRRREGIHKYVIHRADPRLERYGLDYSGYPAPYRGFSQLRFAGPAIDRALRIASRPLPFLRGSAVRRPAMDTRGVLEPGLKLATDILLTPHPIFDPLVNRPVLERELGAVANGSYDKATAIIQLLTFRLFLDLFA